MKGIFQWPQSPQSWVTLSKALKFSAAAPEQNNQKGHLFRVYIILSKISLAVRNIKNPG